eukprot:Pgem_evm1s1448
MKDNKNKRKKSHSSLAEGNQETKACKKPRMSDNEEVQQQHREAENQEPNNRRPTTNSKHNELVTERMKKLEEFKRKKLEEKQAHKINEK